MCPGGVLERGDVHRGGDGGCRTVADRGRDLLGQLRANVADRPDPLHRGLHVPVGLDVPGCVVVDVNLQERRVRDEADEDEDAAHVQLLHLPVLLVKHVLNLVVPRDLLHVRVEDELDLRVRLGALDEDRLGAQLAASMQDVDP